MFTSLLIANRGEIACRIIDTARQMGIRTIAVYSEADADARHVRLADEAICIGPAAASQSYLDGSKILDAARQSKAEAIHPGYGFLSENPDFAQSCTKAGIIFVGPSAESMRKMALKNQAKLLMEKANVPVTPGYHGEAQDEKTLLAAAAKIGYPVLIKAVAGGR
ncbi:MAG: methylcrotonoyl-CoA carboxylase, partial [Robiginitomaculum sp.]